MSEPQPHTGYPHPGRSDYWADRNHDYRGASARPDGALADWGEVDATLIRECIVALSHNGNALLLGNSYDGGAYYLVACCGRFRYRANANTVEAVEWQLDQWIQGHFDIRQRGERLLSFCFGTGRRCIALAASFLYYISRAKGAIAELLGAPAFRPVDLYMKRLCCGYVDFSWWVMI